jgi:hypothetical protein
MIVIRTMLNRSNYSIVLLMRDDKKEGEERSRERQRERERDRERERERERRKVIMYFAQDWSLSGRT